MKLFKALCLLGCGSATGAFAQSTADLSNPEFLPARGQLYSTSSVAYSDRNQDWQPIGGPVDEHFRSAGGRYGEQLEYGITNRFTLGALGTYETNSGQYLYTDRPASHINNDQLSNFLLNAYYQMLDGRDHPVGVYVEGTLAPGLVNNAPVSEGLHLFLNRDFLLESDFRPMGLTLQGQVGVAHADSYTATAQTGARSEVGSRWSYVIAAHSQLRVTPRWAVNSGVAYREDASNSVTPPDLVRYYDSAETTVAPYANIAYALLPHRASIALEYEHDFLRDERHIGGSNPGSWINQSQNLYTLRLFLLF